MATIEPPITIPTAIDHEPVDGCFLSTEEEESALAHAKKEFLRVNKRKFDLLQFSQMQIQTQIKDYFTTERISKILETARENKLQNIWHEEQTKKRIEEEQFRLQELRKKCDAKYFLELMEAKSCELSITKTFIKNNNTLSYIKTICYYLGGDPRFETELNYDFNKGLWIRGTAGVGKSFLLECICENEWLPFKIHSMNEITEAVKYSGEYFIGDILKVIDDVGTGEYIVNYFGTRINWFQQFIELYYTHKKPFNQLIITTNLNFQEIEQKFGFRVRSRVKQMFNIVDVCGEDLRGY